ncbi:MAG TPA: Ig-like domain-containing protein, partial [Gemmatimonadaceae bacterium]|nr:Ig-like domain-containing protein [Gemmatimonadaceae bacterium]
SGNVLTGRTITWSSANTAVATVDGSGLVHAVGAGNVNIVATAEGINGSASLGVSSPAAPAPAPVASVSVSLQSSSVAVGGTSQATATLRDSSGNALTGRTVTWSSSNTLVGTVSASGVVTGVAAGTATITATSEGRSGSASITVTLVPVASVAVTLTPSSVAAGQAAQAAAVLKDAQGNPLTGRTVAWSSSNAAVATVSSSGAVQAVAAGTATITATITGVTGSATLTVTQVPVASATVTLNSPSLTAGQSTQASAVTKDASGNVLTGRAITWSSSNTAVATVSSSGVVQAIAAGTASISATSEGKTGSATLTVTSAPVATVTLSPASVSLPVAATQQIAATDKDASGNTLSGRAITWASNATAVATVSSTGLVSAVGAGSATITATSEGKIGTTSVTVTTAVSPGPGVPVYDPTNSTHVLHVFEDWSAYSSPSQVGQINRADGGGPWLNGNSSFQTLSTSNVDPWYGKKTLDINYQGTPAANSAFERGVTLVQGTPARYLNASSAREAIVLEWAWRWEGAPYEGKIADFQPYAGTDRFNYQTDPDYLGSQQQTSCDADPLCSKYYTNNGNTPRFAGLTPSANYGTGAIARSMYAQNPMFYRQNRNWAPGGNGTGSVDWGGNSWQTIGITFADNRWRRTIIRLTMNSGAMGTGRIEEWLQIAGQPAVKVMEFIGDPGGFDAGLVNGRDVSQGGNTWLSSSATLYLYTLTAVGGIYNGGNTTHLGYVRIWSEPRQ